VRGHIRSHRQPADRARRGVAPGAKRGACERPTTRVRATSARAGNRLTDHDAVSRRVVYGIDSDKQEMFVRHLPAAFRADPDLHPADDPACCIAPLTFVAG
jgi:hypothetical protein